MFRILQSSSYRTPLPRGPTNKKSLKNANELKRIKLNHVTPFVKAGATFSAVLLRTAFTGLKYPGL